MKFCPVPQNAPHLSVGMNPERVGLAREPGSLGVNVLNFPERQHPKATEVSSWYGVYRVPLVPLSDNSGLHTWPDLAMALLTG